MRLRRSARASLVRVAMEDAIPMTTVLSLTMLALLLAIGVSIPTF